METLIIDLDNTIYPVSSIGEKLFAPIFELLAEPAYGLSDETIENAKLDIQRLPFQKVAAQYQFPEKLTSRSIEILKNTTYNEVMEPFEDYHYIKDLPVQRFLLTSGFLKLQQSKVKQLNLESDFEEIFILDPETTTETKKDVIEKITHKYNLNNQHTWVIGDDPESEIKAASELGLKSILIDKSGNFSNSLATFTVTSLKQAEEILKEKIAIKNSLP